jgi:hypothetical protein
MLIRIQFKTAIMEQSMESPQKAKDRIVIWLIFPSPGHISKGTCVRKNRLLQAKVYQSTIHNSQATETAQIPASDK